MMDYFYNPAEGAAHQRFIILITLKIHHDVGAYHTIIFVSLMHVDFFCC